MKTFQHVLHSCSFVCVCFCLCVYIYTYIYRERERAYKHVYIYIYIYITRASAASSPRRSGPGRRPARYEQLYLLLILLLLVVVVVVVPNGLLIDLWAKHTFSKNMYKTIGKHYMFEQPMLQKNHKK